MKKKEREKQAKPTSTLFEGLKTLMIKSRCGGGYWFYSISLYIWDNYRKKRLYETSSKSR